MLSEEQQKEVKTEFLSLVDSIKREGCDIEGLKAYLDASGFFTAPASTQYHCSFEGGLALHSLNVYKILKAIANKYAVQDIPNPEFVPIMQREKDKQYTDIQLKQTIKSPVYSADTLLIVGLFHDISRAGFYTPFVKNEKVYSSSGKKSDEMGSFDWVSSKSYKVNDADKRFLAGSKGFNSSYILGGFIPLSLEETSAILNQNAGMDKESIEDLGEIMSKFNLTVYLHSADLIATYCIEKQ